MATRKLKWSKTREKETAGTGLSRSLGTVAIVVAATMMMLNNTQVVETAPISTTNDSMVVAKTMLAGSCIDNTGTEVADLAEWSSGCDKVVCHVEPSGNYTVTHGCRTLGVSENPDDVNCVTVTNSTAAYPSCCPYLQCGAANYSPSTPSVCFDISDTSSCLLWKELSGNCSDTSAFVYNFTLTYCQQTCGFCSVGPG